MELQTRSEAGLSWNYLPITLARESMAGHFRAHILPLVRPSWRDCTVQTKIFTEGITNVLCGFYVEHYRDDMVLLRMNGEGTDDFLNRRNEVVVMLSLHRAGLIPPLFLEVANGLCYGYVPGRPLTVKDMKEESMMQRTACCVARLHAVPVPDTLLGSQPQVWTKISLLMKTVNGVYKDTQKTERFQQIFGSLKVISDEVNALQLELNQLDSQLVFCHNDLLCGNLIYNSSSGTVSLVDFEYGGANCAAYDIGNHFCEFPGISDPVDYSRYPSKAVQYKWIKYYLQETFRMRGQDPASVSDGDIHGLYRDVNKYALAAHLFWTVWSLLQAARSTIDFDYVEYAGVRFAEYKRRKKLFLSM